MRIERIGDATLYTGDVLACLRAMPEESVNCVVTSPPYWGLRDYDVAGQLGLEPTPEEYTAKMVDVFAEVRRVLRHDGSCWVNLGDSYNAYNGGAGPSSSLSQGAQTEERPRLETGYGLRTKGLKPKDLCGIPWRMAFALQADGWYLRSEIIWSKKNPMPESVTDRPTKSHEQIFLLTKSARYWYDAEAVREAEADSTTSRNEYGYNNLYGRVRLADPDDKRDTGLVLPPGSMRPGRNLRTVWTIATQAFSGAHFAVFPEKLVEPCVLAGCPAQTCPECGAPWERVVEKPQPPESLRNRGNGAKMDFHSRQTGGGQKLQDWYDEHPAETTGHRPTCACAHEDTVPGTVLDPFCGSGTALLVALRLGRRAIGIELKPEYMDMTRKRIAEEAAQGKLL